MSSFIVIGEAGTVPVPVDGTPNLDRGSKRKQVERR